MSSDAASALADAPSGYVEIGPDGVVVAANREFLDMAGRDEADVVGVVTFASLLSGGGRIYYETHYRPTLQMQGRIREIAFDLVRPDGDRIPILVSANVRPDDGVTRTIVFGAGDRRRYEQELLRARRDAEAAEARARALAETLQRTFVPPTMPDVPGLEIAGAYRPAGDGTEVGGDFYDVFQISDGEWVVTIGDVCGKGVDAAALTSFVRHSVRALAVQLDEPSQVLHALNTALLAHRSERFCTILVMRLLRDGDRWLATISSGGHPLPLLVTPDQEISEIGAAGSLIGVLPQPQLADARHTLTRGQTVVLFTDGVTEARTGARTFGLEGVVSVLDGGAAATDVTERLLGSVLSFQQGRAVDDIAIVALTVGGDAAQTETERTRVTDSADKERALLALDGLVADEI